MQVPSLALSNVILLQLQQLARSCQSDRVAEDRYTADTLLATGVVQVEQFCSGFDGMIPLSVGGAAAKHSAKRP